MILNLEVPELKSNDPSNQIKELIEYLNQYTERLTFILSNIDMDNLSSNLIDKLGNNESSYIVTSSSQGGGGVTKSYVDTRYNDTLNRISSEASTRSLEDTKITADIVSKYNSLSSSINTVSTNYQSADNSLLQLIRDNYADIKDLKTRVSALEGK